MKNINFYSLILLLIIFKSAISQENNIITRDTSSYFPSIGDSSGYQEFYALELFRKEKLNGYSREGSHIKFSWKRKPIKGRWYFYNFPDTIIVKEIKHRNNLIISVNDIPSVQFKRYGGNTGGQIAITTASLLLLKSPSLGYLVGPGTDWSMSYLLLKPFINAKINIRREIDYDKELREKVEEKQNKETPNKERLREKN